MIINQYASGVVVDPDAVSIYAALVAYWTFDENGASTTFASSIGAHPLTIIAVAGGTTADNTNTGTGVIAGRAYEPQGGLGDDNTAYIPRSDTGLDLPNSDWSYWFWLRKAPTTGGSTRFIVGRWGATAGNSVACVTHNSADDELHFICSADGTAATARADSGVAPTNTAPQLVCVTHDRSNSLIRIRVKGTVGPVNANVTAAFASALYTGSSTANFCFANSIEEDGTFFSGTRGLESGDRIDEAGYVSKALSDDEVDYLYNGGLGRSWAALAADSGH